MRILLALVGLLALAWGGYWYVGSTAMERAVAGWFDARRAEGWLAQANSIKTRGFPNRFDTTMTGVQIIDPDTGVGWTAPFFQILTLSYRPNHIIATFPKAHSLATRTATVEFASQSTTGSMVFAPDSNLTLDRTSFVVEDLQAKSTAGWMLKARELRFATRQTPVAPFAHEIALEGVGMAPGEHLSELARKTDLPPEIDTFHIDSVITFDAPWDRFSLERARPQPRAITLRSIRAKWGDLAVQATGELLVDISGVPEGEILLRAENWPAMLDLLDNAGLIPERAMASVETVLSLLAGMSGGPDDIDTTLKFSGGRMSVGPLPVGPAPRIILR